MIQLIKCWGQEKVYKKFINLDSCEYSESFEYSSWTFMPLVIYMKFHTKA